MPKKNDPGDLQHHGILGMRWGVRRYQNKDGSLTPAGQKRYNEMQGSRDKHSAELQEIIRDRKEDLDFYEKGKDYTEFRKQMMIEMLGASDDESPSIKEAHKAVLDLFGVDSFDELYENTTGMSLEEAHSKYLSEVDSEIARGKQVLDVVMKAQDRLSALKIDVRKTPKQFEQEMDQIAVDTFNELQRINKQKY